MNNYLYLIIYSSRFKKTELSCPERDQNIVEYFLIWVLDDCEQSLFSMVKLLGHNPSYNVRLNKFYPSYFINQIALSDFQAKDTIAEESKATTRIVDFSFEISSVIESFNNSDMDRSDSGTLVRKMSDENLKNAEKHTVLGFTTPLSKNLFL